MESELYRRCFRVSVIRSGDYYMFEHDNDEDEVSLDSQEKKDSVVKAREKDDEEHSGKLDPFQVTHPLTSA